MMMGFMGVGLLGKGMGGVGWGVMGDRGGKEMRGVWGGVLKMLGKICGMVRGMGIGYMVGRSGWFNGGVIYVGVDGLMGVVR